jgi:hypothetical protein
MPSLIGRALVGTATLVLALATAIPAFAADALFSGTVNRLQYGYYTTFATNPGTGVAATQGGGSKPGFTIPSKAFSGGSFSYTAAFPGYPYFKAYRERFMTKGSFTKSFKVPGTSYTIMKPGNPVTAPYPNALPTTPAPGYIRVKAGPRGFGGFWGAYDKGTIIGTLASPGGGGGYSDFLFKAPPAGAVPGIPKGLDHDGGKNNWTTLPTTSVPQTLCCAYSVITNQTFPSQMAGLMGAHVAGVGHITGTIVVSAPAGGYVTKATYVGTDARTPSGLNGTISMVAPATVQNYLLANPPTFDGNSSVQQLFGDAAHAVRTQLTFLPEPTQLLMLASGITGLFLLRRLSGRR